jgi:hypothetical protein
VLVLGALGFRDRKETDVLQLICSGVRLRIGILEDETPELVRQCFFLELLTGVGVG